MMIDREEIEPAEEQFSASVAGRDRATMENDSPVGSDPAGPLSGIAREFGERNRLERELDRRAQGWREDVARTVQSYRTKRSRKRLAGEFSMKLDFDGRRESLPASMAASAVQLEAPAEEEELPTPGLPPALPARAHHHAPELLEDLEPEPSYTAPVEMPKVLAFPRLPSFDPLPPFDGLAEPILDKPRILEVPEAVEQAPAPLASLRLESEQPEEEGGAASLPRFDVPLPVAPLPRRISAALVDALIVIVATAMFAMIVARTTAALPHTRATLALAVVIPCVFWAVYQYIFLVHGGATPGMQLTHVAMTTFDGLPAPRAVRRWRALFMALSCASLGLGFLWALLDEDTLCWHDKMTRTYLRSQP